MPFIKKFAVFREVTKGFSIGNKQVGGIARLECDLSSEFSVSLFNLSSTCIDNCFIIFCFPSGSYFIEKVNGDSSLKFSFPSRLGEDGFSLLIYEKNDKITPIALASSGDFSMTVNSIIRMIEDEEKKNNSPAPSTENLVCSQTVYNDEQIASYNYYEAQKLNGENDERDFYKQDECACTQSQTFQTKNKKESTPFDDEACCPAFQSQDYYLKIKDNLEKIFSSYKEDLVLSYSIPNSKWVKINYDDGYYLIGVINENSTAKYICYALPASYSPLPPKELEGISCFIPISIFQMRGDGFWVIFQNADTGECEKFKN